MSGGEAGHFMICRLCGKSKTLASEVESTSWYLIHAVKTHWDMLEKLRDASPEMVAIAIGIASAKGWFKDVDLRDLSNRDAENDHKRGEYLQVRAMEYGE